MFSAKRMPTPGEFCVADRRLAVHEPANALHQVGRSEPLLDQHELHPGIQSLAVLGVEIKRGNGALTPQLTVQHNLPTRTSGRLESTLIRPPRRQVRAACSVR